MTRFRFQKALMGLGLGFLFRGTSPFPIRSYIGDSGYSISGRYVDEKTALTISAVLACVRIITTNEATIPCFVYKKTADGKQRAENHFLYSLIHDKPNRNMTSATFFQVLYLHLLLWGNHFSLIDRLAGEAIALWPLEPSRVRIVLDPDGRVAYEYSTATGIETYAQDDILHVKHMSMDGVVGLSPIQLCRQSMGLSLAAEEFGAGIFKNGGRPSGVLKVKGELSEDAGKRLRESWEHIHSGAANQGRVAILEDEADYQAITMNLNDVQFLATRKFQVQDIARIFGVPPHLIQEQDQPTYASVESQKDEFLTFTLRPLMVFVEQELNKRFLGGSDGKYFASFNFEAFLRADIKTRFETYAVGINWGIYSPNDCREKEGMDRRENGDTYLQPLNMAPSSGAHAPTPDLTPQTPGVTPTQKPQIPPAKPN